MPAAPPALPTWDQVTSDPRYQNLPGGERLGILDNYDALIKTTLGEAYNPDDVAPYLDAERQKIAAEGQSPISTAARSFMTDAGQVATGSLQGLGTFGNDAAAGIDQLTGFPGAGSAVVNQLIPGMAAARAAVPYAEAAQQGIEDFYQPDRRLNPISATIGGGAGQAVAMLPSMIAGPVGPLALGAMQGYQQGAEQATDLGIQNPFGRMALGAGFAGSETALNRIGGIGAGPMRQAMSDVVNRIAGQGLKTIASEAIEEPLTGVAQDAMSLGAGYLAGTEQAKLDPLMPTAPGYLERRGMEALGGAVGGAVSVGAIKMLPAKRKTDTDGTPPPLPRPNGAISREEIDQAARARLAQLERDEKGQVLDPEFDYRDIPFKGRALTAAEQSEKYFLQSALANPNGLEHEKLATAYGFDLKQPGTDLPTGNEGASDEEFANVETSVRPAPPNIASANTGPSPTAATPPGSSALASEDVGGSTPPTGAPNDKASSPSPNLPPRASQPVAPRPPKQGRDTTERDAWDEQYGNMRRGGRSHNEDGSPYQPTLHDEMMGVVMTALKGANDDERIAAIGDQHETSVASSMKTLINDGWIWDANAKKMVNPANLSETPINGIARLQSKVPSPTGTNQESAIRNPEPAISNQAPVPSIDNIGTKFAPPQVRSVPVIPDSPLGVMDSLDFLNEMPIAIGRSGTGGELDWQETASIPKYYRPFIASEQGQPIDTVAQAAYEANLIPQPTADALMQRVQQDIGARRTYRVQSREQTRDMLAQEKQAVSFDKSQNKLERQPNAQPVPTDALVTGDRMTIDGEEVIVRAVESDEDGYPTKVVLEDGKRFGVQEFNPQTKTGLFVDEFQPRARAEGSSEGPFSKAGPQRGLGRGLGALLGTPPPAPAATPALAPASQRPATTLTRTMIDQVRALLPAAQRPVGMEEMLSRAENILNGDSNLEVRQTDPTTVPQALQLILSGANPTAIVNRWAEHRNQAVMGQTTAPTPFTEAAATNASTPRDSVMSAYAQLDRTGQGYVRIPDLARASGLPMADVREVLIDLSDRGAAYLTPADEPRNIPPADRSMLVVGPSGPSLYVTMTEQRNASRGAPRPPVPMTAKVSTTLVSGSGMDRLRNRITEAVKAVQDLWQVALPGNTRSLMFAAYPFSGDRVNGDIDHQTFEIRIKDQDNRVKTHGAVYHELGHAFHFIANRQLGRDTHDNRIIQPLLNFLRTTKSGATLELAAADVQSAIDGRLRTIAKQQKALTRWQADPRPTTQKGPAPVVPNEWVLNERDKHLLYLQEPHEQFARAVHAATLFLTGEPVNAHADPGWEEVMSFDEAETQRILAHVRAVFAQHLPRASSANAQLQSRGLQLPASTGQPAPNANDLGRINGSPGQAPGPETRAASQKAPESVAVDDAADLETADKPVAKWSKADSLKHGYTNAFLESKDWQTLRDAIAAIDPRANAEGGGLTSQATGPETVSAELSRLYQAGFVAKPLRQIDKIGGEHNVEFREDRVYKETFPETFGCKFDPNRPEQLVHASPLEYIKRWRAFSEIFPSVRFEGVVLHPNGSASLQISQAKYNGLKPSKDVLDEHLKDDGWKNVARGTWTKTTSRGTVRITDVKPDNFAVIDGLVVPLDVITTLENAKGRSYSRAAPPLKPSGAVPLREEFGGAFPGHVAFTNKAMTAWAEQTAAGMTAAQIETAAATGRYDHVQLPYILTQGLLKSEREVRTAKTQAERTRAQATLGRLRDQLNPQNSDAGQALVAQKLALAPMREMMPSLAVDEAVEKGQTAVIDPAVGGSVQPAVKGLQDLTNQASAEATDELTSELEAEDLDLEPEPSTPAEQSRADEEMIRLRQELTAGKNALTFLTATWQKILATFTAAGQNKGAMVKDQKARMAARLAARKAAGSVAGNRVQSRGAPAVGVTQPALPATAVEDGMFVIIDKGIDFDTWQTEMVKLLGAKFAPQINVDLFGKAVAAYEKDLAVSLANVKTRVKAKATKQGKGTPQQRKATAQTEEQKAKDIADNILNQIAERYADPTIWKNKKAEHPVRKLYREHIKQPLSQEEFANRLQALKVSPALANTLAQAANMEIKARAQVAFAESTLKLLKDSPGLARMINQLRDSIMSGLNWKQIFTSTATQQRQWELDTYAAIRQHPALQSLNAEQAKNLTRELSKAWQSKRRTVWKRELNRTLIAAGMAKPKIRAKIEASAPRLLALINLGALDARTFRDAVAKEFGLRSMNDAEVGKIKEAAEKLQGLAPGTVPYRKAAQKFMEGLESLSNLSGAQLLESWWTASVLSGWRTQMDILFGVSNAMEDIGIGAVVGAIRTGNYGVASRAIFATIERAIQAVPEAFQMVVTGNRSLQASFDAEIRAHLEEGYPMMGQAGRQLMAKGGWRTSFGAFQVAMGRIMSALDHITSSGSRAGALWLARANHPEIFAAAVNITAQDRANARKQALQILTGGAEPTTTQLKQEVKRYTQELLDARHTLPEIEQQASDVGLQSSLQSDPTGLGFLAYELMRAVPQKADTLADRAAKDNWVPIAVKLLRMGGQFSRVLFGTKFIRTAGNAITRSTNYVPGIGALNLMDGRSKIGSPAGDIILGKQLVGFVLFSGLLYAFRDREEEDDMGIEGGWKNLNADQRGQLLNQGKQPYSVWYRDAKGRIVSINYQQWSVANLLAAVGFTQDQRRYHGVDADAATVAQGLGYGLMTIADKAQLQGISTILGRDNNRSSGADTVKGLNEWAAGLVGGMSPRLVKDIEDVIKPQLPRSDYWWQAWAREVPILRSQSSGARVDIFGREITIDRKPLSRIYQTGTVEPEYQILAKLNQRDVWISDPTAHPRKVKLTGSKESRDMLPLEKDRYAREAGKMTKDWLLQTGPQLLQMEPAPAQKMISQRTELIRAMALNRAVRR